MVSQIPTLEEIESFTEEASQIARLVDGLRSGSLPPEYIDEKTRERNIKHEFKIKEQEEAQKPVDPEVKLESSTLIQQVSAVVHATNARTRK